jgi:hypothetical protein
MVTASGMATAEVAAAALMLCLRLLLLVVVLLSSLSRRPSTDRSSPAFLICFLTIAGFSFIATIRKKGSYLGGTPGASRASGSIGSPTHFSRKYLEEIPATNQCK